MLKVVEIIRQNGDSNSGRLESGSIRVAPLYTFETTLNLILDSWPLATLTIWGRGLSVSGLVVVSPMASLQGDSSRKLPLRPAPPCFLQGSV